MENPSQDRYSVIEMGYEINWSPRDIGQLKLHPFYQEYSNLTLEALIPAKINIQADLGTCLPNEENAIMISYLSWLLRCIELQA